MSDKISVMLATIESHNYIVGDIKRGIKLYERGVVTFAKDANLGYSADMPGKGKHDLREALRAINSAISKCDKAQLKLTEGTLQHTLTKRRLEAFYIAASLIEKEMRRRV